MADGSGAPQRHVVVFDCNVWLDVARITGPFKWDTFNEVAVAHGGGQLGTPFPYYDSLRAVAVATSGTFVGDQPLEVWSNDHIDSVVHYKATQAAIPDPETGYRGLGWGKADADSLLDLIDDMIDNTGGGHLGDTMVPDGHPPLDHEDGMVYGACRRVAGEDPLAQVWCVTNDGGFIKAYRTGKLERHSKVLTPSNFVGLVRNVRAQASMQAMRSRSPSGY